ncbi:DNA repair protein RecO [Chlamydia sp.]|uniref:DNA repair protein RecO n=1 Tax=Chlamydia sp. TaxID=35827 RepID=UPI0025C1733D|nr:DNA repair protein RecO [Chlamydia sp.]MBQ8498630.1 DNA repair protein RecO [Chlamydia sp.]
MQITLPGVVLAHSPSEKQHVIAKIFSPAGLVSAFAKNGSSLSCDFRESLLPISFSLFTIQHTPPKIRKVLQGELKDPFSAIKNSYPLLQSTGKMVQAILKTQWHEKPSPHLFSLFLNFLQRIPETPHPQFFSSMFLLKLLQHEGSLDLSYSCASCKISLDSTTIYRYEGELFCEKHAHEETIPFSLKEEQILRAIVKAKKFQELMCLAEFPLGIDSKIDTLFSSILSEKLELPSK